jgi:hypothetical protein
MLVGYMANNVLPARLGELVKCHYLGDREGISRSATLGTVVVERIVDTVVLVTIGAVAILILGIRGVVASAVLVGVALTALLCVGLVIALAAHRLPGAMRVAAFLGRWPKIHGIAVLNRPGFDGGSVHALTLAVSSIGGLVALVQLGWAHGVRIAHPVSVPATNSEEPPAFSDA